MCRWGKGQIHARAVLLAACLYISECVCAVCRGRRAPAADSVGADVGEVLWASESLPVVPEVQRPQG